MSIKFLVSGLLSLGLCGCHIPVDANGRLAVAIRWPQASFSTLAMPQNTSRILLTISGKGLDSPLQKEFSRSGTPEERLTLTLPIGDKQVKVEAQDDKGLLLAEDSDDIEILPGQNSRLEMDLKLVVAVAPPLLPTSSGSGGGSSASGSQPSSPRGGGAPLAGGQSGPGPIGGGGAPPPPGSGAPPPPGGTLPPPPGGALPPPPGSALPPPPGSGTIGGSGGGSGSPGDAPLLPPPNPGEIMAIPNSVPLGHPVRLSIVLNTTETTPTFTWSCVSNCTDSVFSLPDNTLNSSVIYWRAPSTGGPSELKLVVSNGTTSSEKLVTVNVLGGSINLSVN